MGEQSTGTWNSRAWHDEVEERKARFKEHNRHVKKIGWHPRRFCLHYLAKRRGACSCTPWPTTGSRAGHGKPDLSLGMLINGKPMNGVEVGPVIDHSRSVETDKGRIIVVQPYSTLADLEAACEKWRKAAGDEFAARAAGSEYSWHGFSTVIAFFGVRAAVKALNLEYET